MQHTAESPQISILQATLTAATAAAAAATTTTSAATLISSSSIGVDHQRISRNAATPGMSLLSVQNLLTAVVSATLSSAAEAATLAAATTPLAQTIHTTIVDGSRDLISIRIPALFQQLWTWQPTFMQGFLLGQFSMLVLLVMAIKYILFEEPLGKKPIDEDSPQSPISPTAAAAAAAATADASETKGRTVVQEGGFGLSKFMIFSRKQKEPQPDDVAEELAKIQKEIISRTGYDLMANRSESCDWLTVFLAQIIAKFRADAERHDRLVRVISEALNGELRPSVIDNLRITQFSLGSDFLRITSARMVPSSGSLGMRAELDLALQDEITLGFNTRVLVNWPRSSVAALPVSMVVSLVKFVGTMAVEFECASPEPSVSVTILPDYVLEFDVQTLIGSKAKVQNLPMLTSVICRKLQAAFAKELVMPNEKRFNIKHPFTSKPPAPPTAAAAAAAATSSAGANNSSANNANVTAPQSPPSESNRPTSPMAPRLTELPPDYNTQLPPPHPLRSNLHSRATANPSSSPQMGIPPRMYTPDEPLAPGAGHARSPVLGAAVIQQPQTPKAWSPESSVYSGITPQIRPIIGISSGHLLGPTIGGHPRIISVGTRLSAAGSSFPQAPAGLASALAYNGGSSASHILRPGSSIKQPADAASDDLQIKDSVRQRVNRVIRTVNES
ncbi:ERMES complex subunit mmm1 [Coemansia sp. RSA 485]|nr:ERMES complex subunit mmm1 [Coemansia sp. RSA 485]